MRASSRVYARQLECSVLNIHLHPYHVDCGSVERSTEPVRFFRRSSGHTVRRKHSDALVAPELTPTRGPRGDDQAPGIEIIAPLSLSEECDATRWQICGVGVNLLEFFGSPTTFASYGVVNA